MQTLRIIAGIHGGRHLIAPPGLDTRPMPDRIKQSLFDWLGQDLSGQRVADVCAGSGTVGFEALSRNASEVHLIEAGRHAWPALQANLRALGSPPQARLHLTTFQAALPTLKQLDLIFADPPFPWFSFAPETLSELFKLAARSLASGGELVLRGERGQQPPSLPRTLRKSAERFYGRSWVVRYAVVPALPESPQSSTLRPEA